MSWAAHEFENYFLQRHTGLKASFLGIALGTFLPDLLTKAFVYAADDPAQFHRGWPGVGFTHSLIFGFAVSVGVLGATRSRSWAAGILIGQWAHVFTDICDTAGVMPFFPFSTERFFFPWRPIRVSPLSIARFFDRAGPILWSELPFCAAATLLGLALRRFTPRAGEPRPTPP